MWEILAVLERIRRGQRRGQRRGRRSTLAAAVKDADRYAARKFPDARILVSRNAGWRDQAPTDKQRAVLQRLRLPVPEGLTRGEASLMISMVKAAR